MAKPRVVVDSAIRVTDKLRALPIDLVPVTGGEISNQSLIGAQALLTRTVTRVDESLLAKTGVEFVGTASAGTDHIDLEHLAANDISFASAAGCNAAAVGDYVLSAISVCGRLEEVVSGADVGLVGYGHVGRALADRLVRLGATVKVYDPWVSDFATDVEPVTREEVLGCSVVSLHAALVKTAPFTSYHMIGVKEADSVRGDALFINAGRGSLMTVEAVERLLERGVQVVLDTWPEEPHVPLELLNRVRFGTPHIAGYSELSKNNATDFLIPALISALALDCQRPVAGHPRESPIVLTAKGNDLQTLSALLCHVGRIEQDDRDFRLAWAKDQSAEVFERQRRQYAMRQQLQGLAVSVKHELTPRLANWLEGLGVAVV
jgi:erythronate-4-phosphate dehydrogenase